MDGNGSERPEELDRSGTVIAARYHLIGEIGRGGMGVVYRATHLLTQRSVAVKLLDTGPARDRERMTRFLQEARAAVRLQHPNVVDVLDMGRLDDGGVYLALELLAGETLSARLKREGKLEPGVALELLIPIMSAVAAAHRLGLIHRDLKPDNIFLSLDSAGVLVPKLLDFGIVKDLGNPTEAATITGQILGTPHYMAPEQAGGGGLVGPASDVWSMGVVLYRCLAGLAPFDGPSLLSILMSIGAGHFVPLGQRAPGTPAVLLAAVERALRVDPALRYPDMGAFLQAIRDPAQTLNLVGQRPRTPLVEVAPLTEAIFPPARQGSGRRIAWLGGGLLLGAAALVAIRQGAPGEVRVVASPIIVGSVAPAPRATATTASVAAEPTPQAIPELDPGGRLAAFSARSRAVAARERFELASSGRRPCGETLASERWTQAKVDLTGADLFLQHSSYPEATASYDRAGHALTELIAACDKEQSAAAGGLAAGPPVGPIPADRSARSVAAEHYARAEEHTRRGRPALAIAELTRAIEAAPDFVAALNARGLAHQARGELDKAGEDFDRAIALDAGRAAIYHNRGTVRQALNEPDGALDDYTRAIALEPRSPRSYLNRGTVYSAGGSFGAAAADFSRAIELAPGLEGAHFRRGLARRKLGDLPGAIADYTRAIELSPKDPEPYYQRGCVRAELEDHARAIGDLDEAISRRYSHGPAHLRRALSQLKLGKRAEAARDFRRFLELEPESGHRAVIERHLRDLSRR